MMLSLEVLVPTMIYGIDLYNSITFFFAAQLVSSRKWYRKHVREVVRMQHLAMSNQRSSTVCLLSSG